MITTVICMRFFPKDEFQIIRYSLFHLHLKTFFLGMCFENNKVAQTFLSLSMLFFLCIMVFVLIYTIINACVTYNIGFKINSFGKQVYNLGKS